jgi:diacylglycerol kinase family enzyme
VAGTSVLLDHLRSEKSRSIALGRAGERYFAFNAGLGFDAAVVRHVEQRAQAKRALRDLAFVWAAGREWLVGHGRRGTPVTIRFPDGDDLGPFAITIVANTDPYTYLGPRPLHLHPQASFDTGLDVVGIGPIGTTALLTIVTKVLRDGSHVATRNVTYRHDLAAFTLVADEPRPLMGDGDYAGEHREVAFAAVPAALRVLA